jgi:hypothetical protein
MGQVRLLAGLVVIAAVLSGGCASGRDYAAVQASSMYAAMDATSLSYSNPAALAPLDDHPLRWLGFGLHPAGQIADYFFNRPAYAITSVFPNFFGYSSEDAMLNSQRTGSAYKY